MPAGPPAAARHTASMSTTGSFTTRRNESIRFSVRAEMFPVTSIGLFRPAKAGKRVFSAWVVSVESSGSSKPTFAQWSAIKTPAPPDNVTTATRLPLGLRPASNAWARSASSVTSFTSRMPLWRNAALYKAVEPPRLAVWDAAARAPASDDPTFHNSQGLPTASALRPMPTTLCASWKPSTYDTTMPVPGSSRYQSTRSSDVVTASLPVDW